MANTTTIYLFLLPTTLLLIIFYFSSFHQNNFNFSLSSTKLLSPTSTPPINTTINQTHIHVHYHNITFPDADAKTLVLHEPIDLVMEPTKLEVSSNQKIFFLFTLFFMGATYFNLSINISCGHVDMLMKYIHMVLNIYL